MVAAADRPVQGGGLVWAQDDVVERDRAGGGCCAEHVDEPGPGDAVADHLVAACGVGERGRGGPGADDDLVLPVCLR